METKNFKSMSKEDKIKTVAKFIIENNATVNETAEYFSISESCIKKYINDPNNLIRISFSDYEKIKVIQESLQIEGRSIGGKVGKRSATLKEHEILRIAMQMIKMGWTLEQASIQLNIPKSTIYENLVKIKDIELRKRIQKLFDENRGIGERKQ